MHNPWLNIGDLLVVKPEAGCIIHTQKRNSVVKVNPYPAEPRYALLLQTVKIQISWLLKKPTDLDLHCLPLSI